MKKLLFILSFVFFCSNFVQAQFNEGAPWMQHSNAEYRRSSESVTFQEIIDRFNAYWKTRDAKVKGSGHKPFKRWENFWKNFVNKDGILPTQSELWDTWLAYKALEQNKTAIADVSNWTPAGPFNHVNTGSWSSGQGRINAIIVDPNNENTYYAGAPAGGIWKSTDTGINWTPLSDQLPQIGVSGIAIDYNDSDIIYIATGDDDANDSYSVGVMKSVDGGATWSNTGLNPGNSPTDMNDIYMNPNDSDMLWVATNTGVYKTINGGIDWVKKLNGNIKDIKLKPNNPNTIYAVTSNTFYISADFGETFSNSGVGIGLPAASSRLVIDITPSNPNLVYVLSANPANLIYAQGTPNELDVSYAFQGLYKSSNSGVNFTTQAIYDYNSPPTNPNNVGDIFEISQSWYDMALAVSDTNENEIYIGVLNIWKSSNGGTRFTKLNSWSAPNSPSYTHADIHLLRFYNGALFAGTDGGFYKSSNGGTNFTDLTEGMQIGQFYKISVSKESSNKMVGGLQDNGGYALNAGQWQNYYGADGMDTAFDPFNSNIIYGFTQYGSSLNISSTSGSELSSQVLAPSKETGDNDSGGSWVTPLMANREGDLFSGYSSLYQFCNTYWEEISNNFGSNVNIDVLEIDEVNPDNIYVAINNVLYKSTNRGINFLPIETFTTIVGRVSFNNNITSIEVNNNDSNIVYVTTAGTGNGVYKSNNGGETFANISGSLPSVTKNVIKHQALNSKNPLYLGTSLGVFRYDDLTSDWELFENNLPTVSVTDLEINANDHIITAATYGRGIWQSPIDFDTLGNEIALENIENLNSAITCSSVSGVKAQVKNLGSNTISSIDLQYTLDGIVNNVNWSGTLLPNNTTLIDLPNLNPDDSQTHELKLIVSSAGDTFGGNNEITRKFKGNGAGLVNIVNDFDDESDVLLVTNEDACSGYWQRGVPTGTLLNLAASGSSVYGTNLSGNYQDALKSYLFTGCYNLSTLSSPVLKFKMAFDLEPNFDIVYLEYSTNGIDWNVLGTANDPNWYNSSRTYANSGNSDCQNCPGAQWTGTDATIRDYSYDLSSLNAENSIVFRFVFHSDPYETLEGVIVDDLVIEGTLNAKPFDPDYFSIYPNPSKDIFTIRMAAVNEFDYSVYDITGKLILQKQHIVPSNREYHLDMSQFTKGIYLLKISTQEGETTKKIILM